MNDAPNSNSDNTARLVLLVTLLLVLLMALRSPVDSDLWWHLRAGEQTLQDGRPLLHDTFSFTRAGGEWNNHSWLGQVVLALIYRAGGMPALSWLVALLAAGSLLLVYLQMHAPPLIRAFATALAALVAAPVWVARPQIFSLILFAVTIVIVNQYTRQGKNRLWLLLPLFVLWSNLHAGYTLGLMLIGVSAAGEALDHLFPGEIRPLAWRRIAALIGWGILAFLVTILNPNGIQTWLVPFQTVSVGALQDFIVEWASPDFHDIAQQPFLWLLFAAIAALALSGKRTRGAQLLQLIFFGGLALIARRNFGPFALAAAPVLADNLGQIIDDLRSRLPTRWTAFADRSKADLPRMAGLKKGINLGIVSLIWLAVLLKGYYASHPVTVGQQMERQYPLRAVEYLRSMRPQGNLLNAYNWGGYLIWALPEYPVFVDGRTDLYGDELLGEWMRAVQAEEGWQEVLDERGVRLVLLEPERPLTRVLPEHGWNLLVEEEGYVLYGR